MVITYKIPSGIMRIDAVEFFGSARLPAIRRMFKQLNQDSMAAAEYTPLIREYIRTQEREAHDKMVELFRHQVDAETRYHEAQTRYEEMQSPCYACYTQNKEDLEKAKKGVANAKGDVRWTKQKITETQKMEKRYKGIQEDVNKILVG